MRLLLTLYTCLCLFPGTLQAREQWREVESTNFVFVGNASERQAGDVLIRLEQFRYVLSQVLPGQKLYSPVPVQVYGFRDFDSFEAFLLYDLDERSSVAGYFRRGRFKNVIAIDLSASADAYEPLIFHEYVHLMLSYNWHGLPLWFEEGLAEFYSSGRFSEKSAEIGVARTAHRRRLALDERLSLEELLLADSSAEIFADRDTKSLFYAESWAWTHFFVAGRGNKGRRQLAAFLKDDMEGLDTVDAFQRAFGVKPAGLEAALQLYLERADFPTFRYEVSGLAREDELRARLLSDAEVQLRWAELFLSTDRIDEAVVCLDKAQRLQPSLAGLGETRAYAALMREEEDEALELFERAHAEGEASASGLFHYARTLLGDYAVGWVEAIPEDASHKAARALRRSLALKPGQPQASALLAYIYLVRNEHLDEASALVDDALAVSPDDVSHRYLHGQILARRGDYDGARQELIRVTRSAKDPTLRKAAEVFLERMETARKAPH